MNFISFLIIFPAIFAVIVFLTRRNILRDWLVITGAVIIAACSLGLLGFDCGREIIYFQGKNILSDKLIFMMESVITGFLLYMTIKHRRFLSLILVTIQFAIMFLFEETFGHALDVHNNLFVDKFSVIMGLIIGVIGGLICIYAVGYMRDFHNHYHKEFKDRRRVFFFLLLVFLSAMFGIVFANNLMWLYFFWEVTTLCSFVLIGYKRNAESIRNAFRALGFNLLGGLAFIIGIVYLYLKQGTIELNGLLNCSKVLAILPVILISFAGLTKSAQLPFSSWLTGAMVAPTPVSALLHSSTMVKAGVYVLIRFGAILNGTAAGFMLALIGAITFLITSCIAITQSDAKKVLAYSTIANLGLVVLCAGVGTSEAIWAAVLLVIFHAVSKCLLFLCVGTVEHKLGSRDIDDMTGLVLRMPMLSIMMQIGMAGMFLAPFGMLISKWAVLKALIDYDPILAVFIIYGSAATLMFWVKWMGTVIRIGDKSQNVENTVSMIERIPLGILTSMTVMVCLFFPMLSVKFIEPYITQVFGFGANLGLGNFMIMILMLGLILLFPLSFLKYGKNVKIVDPYMCGANIGPSTSFKAAAGVKMPLTADNYYLTAYFGEVPLLRIGVICACILTAVMIGAAL